MLNEPLLHHGLTQRIIGCGVEVHRVFGAGLFESVYQACFEFELHRAGLQFERKRTVPLIYKGQVLSNTFVADLIVEGTVLVEIKAVDKLTPVHQAQLITYLKLTGCPVGLLMNFNTPVLTQGIRRVEHPDFYAKKVTPAASQPGQEGRNLEPEE